MHVRVQAPTNIAVVKYWGKNPKWEKYLIPTKSSVSFTTDGLYTETELDVEKGTGKVAFELNGKKILPEMKEYEYVNDLLFKLFELFPKTKSYDYKIKSKNNFPTAAGYASSASGFGALAKALQGVMKELEPEIYKKYMSDDKKLSVFARLGSGSATRSIPSEGGFAIWERGIDPLKCKSPEEVSEPEKEKIIFSSTSYSILPPSHWPEFRLIYVKVEQKEKKIKSRAGMKNTIQTNPLYWNWVEHEEKNVLPKVIDSVKKKDFESFAKLCMECSNSLHSMALYTMPRIVYLNETSHDIIDAVLTLNEKEAKAAYTYDAGPNAVVFTVAKHEKEVISALSELVPKENIFATKIGRGPSFK